MRIQALATLSLIVFFFASCQKENDFIENVVPTADAGLSQSITFPTDSVTLSGTGTDADGQVVAYLWSQVSGPAASIIRNPGSPSTIVKFSIPGSYLFQLMVTDNKGATGVDTSRVVVIAPLIKTLNLQPANNPNERQITFFNGSDASTTGTPDIPIEAWTNGGGPYTVREAIKFDLSTIPANATIISANFFLYSYPSPTLNGNLTDANFGTSNSFTIQLITSNWTPSSTGWNTQPSTTTTNQVVASHTSSSTLDLNLDVTNMVKSMVNSNVNYGFFMKLQNEVTYNSRIFVSSFNTSYPDKRPKLVIVYQ